MTVTPLPVTLKSTELRFDLDCPGCQRTLHIPLSYEGRRGTCKHCGHRFLAVAPGAAPSPGPAESHPPCPLEWYAEREAHFDYCKNEFAEAVSHYPGQKRNYQWEQLLDQAKQVDDPEEQKHYYWRAIDTGVHWAEPYERLARIYVRENDFDMAYQICIRYFESDYWRRAPWYKDSKHFLRLMKKIDKKLNGRMDLGTQSDL